MDGGVEVSTSDWCHAWRRGGPIDWTLRVLCVLYLAIVMASAIEQVVRIIPGTPLTTTGMGFIPIADGAATPSLDVGVVIPGSSADRVGIKPGDRVRYPAHPWFMTTFRVGDKVVIIVHHAGARRQVVMPIVKTPSYTTTSIIARIVYVFVLAIAGLLFIRGWWRPAPMLLAVGLTGPIDTNVLFIAPYWMGLPGLVYVLFRVLTIAALAAIPAFAMRLFEEQHHRLPPWQWALLAVVAALIGLLMIAIDGVAAFGMSFDLRSSYFALVELALGLTQLCLLAAAGFLIAGWLRSRGEARNQYRILLIAFSLFPVQILFYWLAVTLDPSGTGPLGGLYDFAKPASSALYPVLLAYAVLRQKLVDVGFVINRTLVYGSASAILLVAFGLTEWAADELIKEQTRVESVVIEASVALAIFLTFHRVRDFVEEHLEAFFFRSWHQNEAALKRFVADAAHIKRPEALKAALIAELRRFTGGAAVGLYLPEDSARFTLGGGDAAMPSTLDIDDPVLVRLRASGERIDPADLGSPLPAALALPMFHRAELIGVVLLGSKPDGDRYRPDEAAALADAVRSVGLDLDALRIEAIEAEAAVMRQQLAAMRGAVASAA